MALGDFGPLMLSAVCPARHLLKFKYFFPSCSARENFYLDSPFFVTTYGSLFAEMQIFHRLFSEHKAKTNMKQLATFIALEYFITWCSKGLLCQMCLHIHFVYGKDTFRCFQ